MSTPPLAHPATLIFDGDCGFCTTAVLWLQRTLPRVPATAPFQWTDLAQYGLDEEQARSMVWFVTGGRRYGGASGQQGRGDQEREHRVGAGRDAEAAGAAGGVSG